MSYMDTRVLYKPNCFETITIPLCIQTSVAMLGTNSALRNLVGRQSILSIQNIMRLLLSPSNAVPT